MSSEARGATCVVKMVAVGGILPACVVVTLEIIISTVVAVVTVVTIAVVIIAVVVVVVVVVVIVEVMSDRSDVIGTC